MREDFPTIQILLGKQPDDHAGHLAGDRFGGSPELDNLVSQLKGVNLSDYRRIENQWARALSPQRAGGPEKVSVDVSIETDPTTGRSRKFDVEYIIGDEFFQESILN